MAFIVPHLPLSAPRLRLSTTTKCRRRQGPVMLENSTIVALVTMAAGIGGGIGLVAWTEQQGSRTEQRQNVQPCTECGGDTNVVCNVCNGTKKDNLDDSKTCGYCEGVGTIRCFNCSGSGIQPRYLDRLSPDDFMD